MTSMEPGTLRRRLALVLLAEAIRHRPDAAWAVLRQNTLAAGKRLDPPVSALELDGLYAGRVADALDAELPPALSVTPEQLAAALASVSGLDPAPDHRVLWDALRRRVIEDATERGTLS